MTKAAQTATADQEGRARKDRDMLPGNAEAHDPEHALAGNPAHGAKEGATEGATGGAALIPARRRAPRPDFRIAEQPGFVLHAWPYRETSLIIDVFTRDHGRVALVAKGAKRAHSALRAVLQGFQPLSLSWTGKGEVRTLTRAEWVGGMPPLSGAALLCGFYLNELLVKFCAREDAHAALFEHYLATLGKLAHGLPPGPSLRSFERMLLQETGYAVAFDRCAGSGEAVQADGDYVFDPVAGIRPARISDSAAWPVISGQTLLDMARDDYGAARTQTQGKQLMRFLLDYHLHGTPLTTRQILIDLHKL